MTFDPSQPSQSQQPFQPAPAPLPPAGSPATPSFIPASVMLAPKKASGGRVATGTIVLVLAGFVAAAGIGFAGGRATAPQATTAARNFGNGANGGNGFPNASGLTGGAGGLGALGGGGTEVTGAVTAVGNGTITLQIAGGQSVTITVPSTATYHGQTAASAADVAVGSQVQVTITRLGFRDGRPDASGAPAASAGAGLSITASDITLIAK
jgi:hypothetical protein